MTLWIALAASAQLITAFIVLVDKYVLVSHEHHVGKPIVYAFYVSVLSGFVVVLLPFGVISMPSADVLALSMLSSVSFLISVYFLYTALKRGHASDAVPLVGAISALATVCLAFALLDQDLPRAFIPAFLLFVIGMALISHFRLSWKGLGDIAIAGIFFALSAVLLKLVFLETDFVDGFFWSRMTNVVAALCLLVLPANRKAIFHGYNGSSHRTKWLVVSNKALGGIAGVLTLLAIHLGSVSIVNAMAGLQFVFLLVLVSIGARIMPRVFKGEVHRHNFPHQVYGALCIGGGLAALFIV